MQKIRRFASYYRMHMRLFLWDMLCALLIAGGDLLYPVVTRSIIDSYIPNRDIKNLLFWCGILVVVYLIRGGLYYFVLFWGHVMGVRMQADMRKELFGHLQRLPFSYFDEHKVGSLMSRIVNDLMEISELAHHGPEDLFISIVMLTGSFFIMMAQNIPLTLIIFAFLPLMLVFALRQRHAMSKAFRRRREEVSGINATIENSISGARVAKAFCNEENEEERFSVSNRRFEESSVTAYKTMADFHSGLDLMSNLIMALVLLAGGLFAANGIITAGQFASYVVFVSLFFGPIKRLMQFTEQYQAGMSGFERFCSIIDTPPEADDPGAAPMEHVSGEIAFCDVSFTYDTKDAQGEDHPRVLDHLSFTVPAGQTVALVGPSGGGKSTICHLIPRFYELQSGKITLDGTDIKKITRQSLRENIGIVEQSVFLFTGTIRENIAYGAPNASEEEIIAAAKWASLHTFILSLPEGYDSYIGEHGVKLSGGQRQRIAVARVFLKNPPILILDEATSALDNQTERQIQDSLESLSKGRTTLVVAHRLSTVKNANLIIVMGEDGILESGSHQALLEQDGVYAGLYRTQFREDEAAS